MSVFWVDAAKTLAIVPRPRGEEWLAQEASLLKATGIDLLVSLLTPPEQEELGLRHEAEMMRAAGVDYRSFPIPDRDVPDTVQPFQALIASLALARRSGARVGAHCRAGIGRSSLTVAGVLCMGGLSAEEALAQISVARGRPVPDTPQQIEWLRRFAERQKQG